MKRKNNWKILIMNKKKNKNKYSSLLNNYTKNIINIYKSFIPTV